MLRFEIMPPAPALLILIPTRHCSPERFFFPLSLQAMPNASRHVNTRPVTSCNRGCFLFTDYSSVMAARGDNNFMRYVYRGEEDEVIPFGATHITVHKSVTVIRAEAFQYHRNIVEVVYHEDFEKIERHTFWGCPRLRRVIMPGVKIVGDGAFDGCTALMDVICDKLEIIGDGAFVCCESLRSLNLPSARIISGVAFLHCVALTEARFSSKLERIEGSAFSCCSLERITIPLKDGLIMHDDTFQRCENLKQVDLVDGELHETMAALQLEEWRNDMYEEIDAINQTLPTAYAGDEWNDDNDDVGELAVAIRLWMRSLLGKIIGYKAEHQRVMDEAVVPTLQHALSQDIVSHYVLPFLELPSYTFALDNHEDYSDDEEEMEEEEE